MDQAAMPEFDWRCHGYQKSSNQPLSNAQRTEKAESFLAGS